MPGLSKFEDFKRKEIAWREIERLKKKLAIQSSSRTVRGLAKVKRL